MIKKLIFFQLFLLIFLKNSFCLDSLRFPKETHDKVDLFINDLDEILIKGGNQDKNFYDLIIDASDDHEIIGKVLFEYYEKIVSKESYIQMYCKNKNLAIFLLDKIIKNDDNLKFLKASGKDERIKYFKDLMMYILKMFIA